MKILPREQFQTRLPATIPVTQQRHPPFPEIKTPKNRTITFTQLCQDALLPYLGTRFILLITGLLTTYYIMPLTIQNPLLASHTTHMAFPQVFWLMWQHFDSGFYINLAQDGYAHATASMLHIRTNWVFYPLYPLLIAGIGRLFGSGNAAFSLAGLGIANFAGLLMIVYFYLLVRNEFSRKAATRAILYLSLFPTALFFSGIYTESLLLGFSIACIYYARRQCWWLAGLCGGLATLTRLQGIMLILPLAGEYLRIASTRHTPLLDEWPAKLLRSHRLQWSYTVRGLYLAAHNKKTWLMALPILLVPCGLLFFMIYGQIEIGDFMATFHASSWGWGRQASPPWRLLIYSLRNPILGHPLNWNFWLANIVASFAFLAAIVWSFRRLPIIYTLYTATVVLLPLSANLLNSVTRYYLLAFPVFILLACWTEKTEKDQWHSFIILTFAALQAIFMVFFVLGLPIMA